MSEIVVTGPPTLLHAVDQIASCQSCNFDAETPFSLILELVSDIKWAEVLFCQSESVLCPNCSEEIWEGTLVSFLLPQTRARSLRCFL
jgi:hypothetical protein